MAMVQHTPSQQFLRLLPLTTIPTYNDELHGAGGGNSNEFSKHSAVPYVFGKLNPDSLRQRAPKISSPGIRPLLPTPTPPRFRPELVQELAAAAAAHGGEMPPPAAAVPPATPGKRPAMGGGAAGDATPVKPAMTPGETMKNFFRSFSRGGKTPVKKGPAAAVAGTASPGGGDIPGAGSPAVGAAADRGRSDSTATLSGAGMGGDMGSEWVMDEDERQQRSAVQRAMVAHVMEHAPADRREK